VACGRFGIPIPKGEGVRPQCVAFRTIVSIFTVIMVFFSNERLDLFAFMIAFALVILGDILLALLVMSDGSAHF
jgi:hypothetical protein